MKTIVTMGRGGTGKTTFVALMAGYLIEKNHTPLLLVDIDPDQNLAEMVGVDLDAAGTRTISELLSETFIQNGGTTLGVPPPRGSRPGSGNRASSRAKGSTSWLSAPGGSRGATACRTLP